MFTLGLLVCFFGLTFIEPIMLMIGFLAGAFLSTTLFFEFLIAPNEAGWLNWYEMLRVSILIGLIVGYFACI